MKKNKKDAEMARLHKEVDAYWGPIAETAGKVFYWSAFAIFDMWRREKEYVDRMGKRLPEFKEFR